MRAISIASVAKLLVVAYLSEYLMRDIVVDQSTKLVKVVQDMHVASDVDCKVMLFHTRSS
jgi:hypothetical protein